MPIDLPVILRQGHGQVLGCGASAVEVGQLEFVAIVRQHIEGLLEILTIAIDLIAPASTADIRNEAAFAEIEFYVAADQQPFGSGNPGDVIAVADGGVLLLQVGRQCPR